MKRTELQRTDSAALREKLQEDLLLCLGEPEQDQLLAKLREPLNKLKERGPDDLLRARARRGAHFLSRSGRAASASEESAKKRAER